MIEPPDDLKRIKGIGPAAERRLHTAGITTFVKLSRLTPAGIARMVPGLPATRIARENWIGQARKLASGKAPAHRRRRARVKQVHQHYATFTVELLLNDDNSVRRTRVTHVQSKYEETWGGWDSTRVVGILVQNAGLRMNLPEPASSPGPLPVAAPPASFEAGKAGAPASSASIVHSGPGAAPKTGLSGVFKICELVTAVWGSAAPRRIVPAGQAFSVRLVMDLTEVTGPLPAALGYTIRIWAKKLGESLPPKIVGEGQGTVAPADKVPCIVGASIAVSGMYRLSIEATLALPGKKSSPQSTLPAAPMTQLLQVAGGPNYLI